MTKKNSPKRVRERDRRAVAEQMRREQARKERQRSILILGGCVVVVIGLLVAALIPYLNQVRKDREAAGTPLAEIGVAASAAGCDPVQVRKATGSNEHVQPPQRIRYPEAPPASGKHWGNFLQGAEIRSFYSPQDRPEPERLVHSLEHGHTILWYDDSTVSSSTEEYRTIQELAKKIGVEQKFMAAPWTSEDGKPFPEGKSVALTHWTGPENQQAVTQYCAAPSGAVVQKFMDAYPKEDAPEPNAP